VSDRSIHPVAVLLAVLQQYLNKYNNYGESQDAAISTTYAPKAGVTRNQAALKASGIRPEPNISCAEPQ
jgi:hypothetical protein